MATTVTWQQSGHAAQTFTISDEAMASLDQYRAMLTAPAPTTVQDGQGNNVTIMQQAPLYPTVIAMIVGLFMNAMVTPAFKAFPPASVQSASEAAQTAAAALNTALQTAIQTAMQPAS
jgi:hypothetical protein